MNRMITTSLLLLTLFLAAPGFAQLYPPPESIEHPESLEPSVFDRQGPLKKRIEAAKIISIDIVGEGIEIESQCDKIEFDDGEYQVIYRYTKVVPLLQIGIEFIMYSQHSQGGNSVPQVLLHLKKVKDGYKIINVIAGGGSCPYGTLSFKEAGWNGKELRFFKFYSMGALFREVGKMDPPERSGDCQACCDFKAAFIYEPETRETHFEAVVLDRTLVWSETVKKYLSADKTRLKGPEMVQFLEELKAEVDKH